MDPKLKQAAARILEISSKLEKRASEQTFFVCDSCNHTASLASINKMRKQAADAYGIKDVEDVTVNDSLECKACGGEMSYVPTEESRKYYVEAAEEGELPPMEEGESEEPKEEPKEELEEEGKPEKKPKKKPEEEGPAEEGEPEEGEGPFKPVDEQESEDIDLGLEGAPGKKPEEEESMEEGVLEEEVPEEAPEKPKKKPKKKKTPDKPDDEKVQFPKDKTPKFEKMPKEASAGFRAAVAKYWPS